MNGGQVLVQVVSDVWVIARREDGARQRHLRHVTTGVADDRDRTLVGSSLLAKALFAFRARISGARSAALFDLLRAK